MLRFDWRFCYIGKYTYRQGQQIGLAPRDGYPYGRAVGSTPALAVGVNSIGTSCFTIVRFVTLTVELAFLFASER